MDEFDLFDDNDVCLEPTPKKKKNDVVPFEEKVLASMQATREMLKTEDDEDDLFGRTVAMKLKKLEPKKKEQTKILIDQLLFSALFE